MIKLTLQGIEGKGKVIYLAVAHIVAIQEAASGCLITTTRSAFHVNQPADHVRDCVSNKMTF